MCPIPIIDRMDGTKVKQTGDIQKSQQGSKLEFFTVLSNITASSEFQGS